MQPNEAADTKFTSLTTDIKLATIRKLTTHFYRFIYSFSSQFTTNGRKIIYDYENVKYIK